MFPQSETRLSELTVGQFQDLMQFNTAHPIPTTKNNYRTTPEAAAFIRKSPEALRQIVYRGEIASIKRGNHLLFLESDLIAWLERGRRKTKAEMSANAEDILVIKRGSKNG